MLVLLAMRYVCHGLYQWKIIFKLQLIKPKSRTPRVIYL
jgi:hypothetical protein